MESFEQLLYQLHLSYLQARKSKRNTHNQLAFEQEQEQKLHALATAIQARTYTPSPSIAFIIQKPVKREIFAADFSDRVIHHLIYRCIYPIIDKKLIYDSYSCRVGKGTLFGINRVKGFMRSCSLNYSTNTYYLKLDIEAFFMRINHQILFDKVMEMLPLQKKSFLGISRATLIYLIEQTIFNDVVQNCHIKGRKDGWSSLPHSKSLFFSSVATGLPIGNLTSQVFGNVYLQDFDQFIKKRLKIKYYGRYVDDMVFVHTDKAYLERLIPVVSEYLHTNLRLTVHPNKINLGAIEDGISFLGHYMKPYRNYIGNRTKDNFYQAIQGINKTLQIVPQLSWTQVCSIRATLNSYLGCLNHVNAFNLRKTMLGKLSKRFYDFFIVTKQFNKVIINEEFWQWHFLPNYQYIN